MIVIENIPSDFLLLENSIFEFSDDSRFIYIHSSSICWKEFSNNIAVFDIIFNKFILLSPDQTATEFLVKFDEFFVDTFRPMAHIIDYSTLLFCFDSSHSDEYNNTTALLMVVQLNFSNSSYSIFDYKIIRDCESAKLVKNGDKFLLIHEFEMNEERSEKSLGYYTFFLQNNNKISQLQGNRIIFDYDYNAAGNLFFWHVHDNKLWFFRRKLTSVVHHISYFDLKENRPKFTPVEFIQDPYHLIFQWGGKHLFRYCEVNGEFSYFNLENRQWSNIYQHNELPKLEESGSKFLSPWKSNTYGWAKNSLSFETNFKSALFIDSTKKQLIKIPLNEPFKLLDIAWTNVLNYGLLPEFDKKGVTIYSKIF